MWMEEDLGTRVNQNRVQEAKDAGADVIATSCPFCQTMIKDGISELGYEEQLKTLDIAEIVAQAMVTAPAPIHVSEPKPEPPPEPEPEPEEQPSV